MTAALAVVREDAAEPGAQRNADVVIDIAEINQSTWLIQSLMRGVSRRRYSGVELVTRGGSARSSGRRSPFVACGSRGGRRECESGVETADVSAATFEELSPKTHCVLRRVWVFLVGSFVELINRCFVRGDYRVSKGGQTTSEESHTRASPLHARRFPDK